MALEMVRRPGPMAEFGRDVVPLRTMMDRLFESAFTPYLGTGFNGGGTGFGWDVYEDNDAYHIHCYLPGVDPNALDITIQDNVLTISGETKRSVPESWRPVLQELAFGQFRRQLTVGTPIEASKAEANYQDGILKLTLPKAETAKPRQIKVGQGAAAR